MLPFLMLTSVLAQAEEPDRINGLRLGLCGGISSECLLASTKVEYAWRRAAINLSFPVVPVMGGANLKLYPFDIREGEPRKARPYAYGGVAGDMFFGFTDYSTGFGVDVHMGENRAVIFQPSIGILHNYWGPGPAAAMSLMAAF